VNSIDIGLQLNLLCNRPSVVAKASKQALIRELPTPSFLADRLEQCGYHALSVADKKSAEAAERTLLRRLPGAERGAPTP
jgi:hypothetical protein